MKYFNRTLLLILLLWNGGEALFAQAVETDRCGSMQWLQQMFSRYPQYKQQYAENEKKLGEAILKSNQQSAYSPAARTDAIMELPIVFHIISANPAAITNAMIQAELDTINKDWGGLNKDSVKIPAAFKPVFGKGNIRFTLAQRTPNNLTTTGIIRYTSNVRSNGNVGDPIKYSSKGGADAWDPTRYINVWVGTFANSGTLGYATFPMGSPENTNSGYALTDQGVVIGAGTLPGGALTNYNFGRTLSHELGHYFWLIHINGDVSCGDDFPNTPGIDDTPLQSSLTTGCPTGVAASGCSGAPTPPGRMYQNFMDYTSDQCMCMFTKGQNTRSEQALRTFRPTLTTSNGSSPVILFSRDISPAYFTAPSLSICEATNVRPVLQVANNGRDTIKTFVVTYSVNGGQPVTVNFNGSLPYSQTAAVPLNITNFNPGLNTIKAYTSLPNGLNDEAPLNDTLVYNFRVLTPVNAPVTEGFEGSFPPDEWDIVQQPLDQITWQKISTAGKNSSSSAYINNYNYPSDGNIDYLISPLIKYSDVDSVIFKFDVASASSITGTPPDTLEVLVTQDCGVSYTSIYKKWGNSLQTAGSAGTTYQGEFFPTSNQQWRTDSINVTTIIGTSNSVRFAFKNTTGSENNIFIDNVNFYTKVLPAKLKETGYLIAPNPVKANFIIQHYRPPSDLKGFGVYNSFGQQVIKRSFAEGTANSYMEVNMQQFPPGLYVVQLIYANRTVSQKIIKVN